MGHAHEQWCHGQQGAEGAPRAAARAQLTTRPLAPSWETGQEPRQQRGTALQGEPGIRGKGSCFGQPPPRSP